MVSSRHYLRNKVKYYKIIDKDYNTNIELNCIFV